MALRVTLICDKCGRIIDEGLTGRAIRDEAKSTGCKVGLPGGVDYCWNCAAHASLAALEGYPEGNKNA